MPYFAPPVTPGSRSICAPDELEAAIALGRPPVALSPQVGLHDVVGPGAFQLMETSLLRMILATLGS